MNIGLGCTVWALGQQQGQLDGIGIYTQALYRRLQARSGAGDLQIQPCAFGRELPLLEGLAPRCLAPGFARTALLSALCNKPLPNSAALAAELDLLHAPDHHIPRIRGLPVVASVMDLIPMLHPEWIRQDLQRVKSWVFARNIRSADHLITISDYSKQDLVQHLNIDPQRISVTPLGVEPVYFEQLDQSQRQQVLDKHQLQPGFLLFVGTLQPRKNLPRVIEAFMRLPVAQRRAHPLVIVGRNGWGNQQLLPQLQELGQRGEVRWLEYLPQDEVMALLQSAVAMVFASLYEGFGLPVIEAFAARCPVLTANTTSVPEVAGEAGWAVDPWDVTSIHQGLLALLDDEPARQQKIRLGLERARQYSWDACTETTLAVYRQVLQR